MLFISFVFSQDILHEDFIITIGEKIYSPFSDKPFNGKIVKFFSFEQIKYEYFVVNGIKDGNYISYFKGGNILEEGTYKEGIKDGSWIKFDQYYNRERKLIHFKSSEYIFKDGKPIKLNTFSTDGSIKKTDNF
tara:strand:- start:329 stop:727 length:399 start_codon:yes stop_codon:yes gene_type:complete